MFKDLFLVIIFLFLKLSPGFHQERHRSKTCPKYISKTKTHVSWPETADKNCAISTPTCFNDTILEPAKRCCHDGKWDEDPCRIFHDDTHDIYYHIILNSEYPPRCISKNVSSFEEYKNFAQFLDIGPYWMPIERIEKSTGFLYWTEISRNYMVYLPNYGTATWVGEHYDCVIYNKDLNGWNPKNVTCESKYTALCAYTHAKAEYIFKKDVHLEEHFTSSVQSVQVNDCKADCPPSQSYKNFTSLDFSSKEDPKLKISFRNRKSFYVEVENIHKLIDLNAGHRFFCFTDATPDSHIAKCGCNKYECYVEPSAPIGSYWCEGFQTSNLNKVASNPVALNNHYLDRVYTVILRFTIQKNISFVELLNFLKTFKYDQSAVDLVLQKYKVTEPSQSNLIYKLHYYIKKNSKFFEDDEEFEIVTEIFSTLAQRKFPKFAIKLVKVKPWNFCLEETTNVDGVTLTWPTTGVGKVAQPRELCLLDGGHRLSRQCLEDDQYGAKWQNLRNFSCTAKYQPSAYTRLLDDLLHSNLTKGVILGQTEEISKNYPSLKSVDVFLISNILEKIHSSRDTNLHQFSRLISNVMNVRTIELKASQKLWKSTDRILYYIDQILMMKHYNGTNDTYVSDQFLATKVSLEGGKEFILSDVHGLKLLVYSDDAFNPSEFGIKEVDIAIVFPRSLVEQINVLTNASLILTKFVSNSLFNCDDEGFNEEMPDPLGILIPGEITKLNNTIKIYYKTEENIYSPSLCSFWHYNSSSPSKWILEGSAKQVSSFEECKYNHTTHFAMLLSQEQIEYRKHSKYLSFITNIGCSLSAASILMIFLTGIIFKQWRNTGNNLLLSYVFSILLQMVLLYWSHLYKIRHYSETICVILGASLHYILLSSFSWSLVIAYLQFKRFVTVFDTQPKNVYLKSFLVGWVSPLIPVVTVLILTKDTYIRSRTGVCYPTGLALQLAILLPISLVLLLNMLIFIYIMYAISFKGSKTSGIPRRRSKTDSEWKLALLLFFMLGFAWIFGFLSELGFGFVCLYLFCIMITLQGFVIFVFFIVLNKKTRMLYINAFRKWTAKGRVNSVTSLIKQ